MMDLEVAAAFSKSVEIYIASHNLPAQYINLTRPCKSYSKNNPKHPK